MTWALWRTSLAVRLCPAVALVSSLDTSRRQLGDDYLLNRLLELDLFLLVFGAGLAGALSAADAGALRRRPGLRHVRLAATRGTATIVASDVLATWTAMVGAYLLALIALCATADRGDYGWGEASLSVTVVAGLALAVAVGQLLGWLLPRYLSPIVAGALPYAVYFVTVLTNDGRGAQRSLMVGQTWAPSVVPDSRRILLATGCTAVAAVVLFLTTTQVVRRGSTRLLVAATAGLVGLATALAVVPSGTREAYYAKVSDRPPRCTSLSNMTLCVLSVDGDLLPVLVSAASRYLEANGAIPGTPSAVSEEGLPAEPQTWTVGSDALLHGADRVVWELAAQHVSPPNDCPTVLPAPEGASGPWSWIVADALARQAGVEPESAFPHELAELNEQQSGDWLRGATMLLRSCRAPTMP